MKIQTTQSQKDALFFLESKGLIDFDLAFDLANGDIPIDENKIKKIINKLDKQTQKYLYQRLEFKDENGHPLGY
jgi:hypothetical protein